MITFRRSTPFLLALLLEVFTSHVNAQAPVKRVFIEEFTASWCGWCPIGIDAAQKLKAKYGDMVVIVAIHDTDALSSPEWRQVEFYPPSPVTGLPDGRVDRLPLDSKTSWNVYPTGWDAAVKKELAKPVQAEVEIIGNTYNPSTNEMSATVKVTFLSDVPGFTRLNLYVTEDSITGAELGQQNALSGDAAFKTYSYYSLPSLITPFYHDHVVHEILGGTFGKPGVIPINPKAGSSYSETFIYTPDPQVNIENVHLVGTVSKFDTNSLSGNEILNTLEIPLLSHPLIKLAIAPTVPYATAPSDQTTPLTIALQNPSDQPCRVGLWVDPFASDYPNGWTVSLASDTVDVPAHGMVLDTVNVQTDAGKGYGEIAILANPVAKGELSLIASCKQSVLTSNTPIVVYQFAKDFLFQTYVGRYQNQLAAVPFNPEALAAYPPKDCPLAVFSCAELLDCDSASKTGVGSVLDYVTSLLASGKNVMITSQQGMLHTFDKNLAAETKGGTDAAKLFYEKLGVQYVGNMSGYLNVRGIPNDPVGNGIYAQCDPGSEIDYFRLTDSASTTVLRFEFDPQMIAAIRHEEGGRKLVYSALEFRSIIDPTIATTFLDQSIDYLLSQAGVGDHPTQASGGISAMPNPCSLQTEVSFARGQGKTVFELRLVDMLGRNVWRASPEELAKEKIALNTSALPSGTYRLILRTSEGIQRLSIAVAK